MKVYMNLSDLLERAAILGIIMPPNSNPDDVVAAIEAGRSSDTYNPTRELRATMSEWVEKYYDQISAQAKCSLDCISCPLARVSACFIYNKRSLAHGRLINSEDPWLRQ
jgi:hypothetical protein